MNDMYISSRRITSHIGAMSAVYGVTGVLPANARILELGCGNAQLLLTHALAWPESECVGIDLDAQTIANAEEKRQQLGVKNVSLYALGLDSLVNIEAGTFDYIIINGIFSLLPETERAVLLAFASRSLTPNGIVAMRWNSLPGSRDAKSIQDAIALHTADATDDEMTLNSARAMIIYLEMAQQPGRINSVLSSAAASSDNEFLLRYLHNFNDAVYLADFNQMLVESEFQYVGDIFPQSECASYYGENVNKVHETIVPGKGKVLAQQYLDFAVNRAERFSIIVPASRNLAVRDEPDIINVESLHWAGCFKRFVSEDGIVGNAHLNRSGHCVSSEDTLQLSIMDLLGDAWPLSVSFEQLVTQTLLPETPENHREKVAEALKLLFVQGRDGLLFSFGPSAYNVNTSPVLQPIPGLPLCENGEEEVSGFNLWGEAITLSADECEFLNGERSINDADSVDMFLTLREKGVLYGAPRAWKYAFQSCLLHGDSDILRQLCMTIILFSSRADIGGFLNDNVLEKREDDPTREELEKIRVFLKKADGMFREGRNEDVRVYMKELIETEGDNVQLLNGISRSFLLTGAYYEALTYLSRLLANHASNWEFYYDLANAFSKTRAPFYAGRIIRALLRNDRENARGWDLLGCLYRDHNNVNDALICARKAVKFEPRNAHYLTNLGTLLSEKQLMGESLKHLKKAVDISGNHLGYYSNYLFVLTHDPKTSPQAMYHAHLKYGEEVDAWAKSVGIKTSYKGSRDPDRKLRVGFVSGDFVRHPVSHFFIPFWDAMDRERFDLIGYNASPVRDDITDYLESGSSLWRDIDDISDTELADQIYNDNIDILIDLSGHTTYCRLPMFGLRPAPVQMTWIGYPATTGMKAIDYRIVPDTILNVPKMQEQFSEHLLYVRMEKTFEPNEQSPDVNELPAIKNGYITFCSFNRPKKINNDVLNVWASILLRLPNAKLMIGFMDDLDVINSISEFMENKGVSNSQLIFKGKMTMLDYLSAHGQVDIMLDAFPYTGGTTTNNAAWMGVPTLTLRGETLAGCQGLDIMYTYGLENFVAFSKDDYVSKAIHWAAHIDELSKIRRDMRSKIPTKQGSGFNIAATFEHALRTAWEMYCRGEKPRSFVVDK